MNLIDSNTCQAASSARPSSPLVSQPCCVPAVDDRITGVVAVPVSFSLVDNGRGKRVVPLVRPISATRVLNSASERASYVARVLLLVTFATLPARRRL